MRHLYINFFIRLINERMQEAGVLEIKTAKGKEKI